MLNSRKKEFKLMSFFLTFAILLSSFIVPTKSQAADEPSVRVLGATIRLDGDSGYQSMRFGIEVQNASKAQACGIVLTLGDKSYTIATDATSAEDAKLGDKIYYYNEKKDVVIYTAVVTKIPADQFGTDIKVQGTVTPIGAEKITSGEPIAKNVNGIIDAMKEDIAGLEILSDGTLCKPNTVYTYDKVSNTFKNTKALTPIFNDGVTHEYDSASDSLKVTTTAKNTGFSLGAGPVGDYCSGLPSSQPDSTNVVIIAKVKVAANNTIKIGRSNRGAFDNSLTATDDFAIAQAEYAEATGNWPTYDLTAANPGDFYVKSFGFYNPLTAADLSDIVPDYDSIPVDLSKVTFINDDIGTYNAETGLLTIQDERTGASDTTEIYLPLSVKIPVGQTVKVTVSGTAWGDPGFRVWTTPSDNRGSSNFVTNTEVWLNKTIKANGSFTGSAEITSKTAECDYLTFKPTWGQKIKGLVISDVKITLQK